MLLLPAYGTVTVCHSITKNLAEVCRRAEILAAAIVRAGYITGDMIKPDAVVTDVSMNRITGGKLAGDAEFASASQIASYITPVAGGIGLIRNTITAAKSTD